MKITAYIPCHNGEAFLGEVLPALRAQTRPADQYLFINDRSTDRSVELAEQFGFEVQHTGPEHFGLAAGRNAALRHALGDILVGTDADAVAEPDFLEQVERQFQKRPELVGLCGCLTEKYANETIFDLWRSMHMRQHYGPNEINDPPILFGSTSCHRTEAVRRVGGWNHTFKTNYEDVDLTQRLRAAGGRTLYSPACRLWHLRRDTLESVLKGWWNWNYPPGDITGSFDSVSQWVDRRLSWIWGDYRVRRLRDRATPQLSVITCLLPWSTTLRDLHQVFGRSGTSVDLRMIGRLAHDVFLQLGVAPEYAVWMGKWLQDVATRLPERPGMETRTAETWPAAIDVSAALPPVTASDSAWDNELLQKITVAALTSIPDATYWSAVQACFVRDSK